MRDLGGRTLLLTRAEGDGSDWAAAIQLRGGRILRLPCIEVQVIREPAATARLRREIARADWLALTSRNGVEALAKLNPAPLPPALRIAAVGSATAAAAIGRLGHCNLVPPFSSSLALGQALAQLLELEGTLARARVVVASADRARRDLEQVLEPRGIKIVRIAVYRTVPATPRGPKLDLSSQSIDAILLASPSAAEGLVNLARIPALAQVITIGPTTTAAARALGLKVTAEADRPNIESILEVLS
jgi:uroporphyrinogen-III synthase